MCDVHLAVSVDETRSAASEFRCGWCRKAILAGEIYSHAEGELDDGSGDRLTWRGHEECRLEMTQEVGEDGCFTWEGVTWPDRGSP